MPRAANAQTRHEVAPSLREPEDIPSGWEPALGGFLQRTVAQFAAQDLADIALGQFVAELDVFRPLVAVNSRLQYSASASLVGLLSRRTTNSMTASPDFSSGTPTAAHSSTPGWLATTASISLGRDRSRDHDHVLLAIDDLDVAARPSRRCRPT
jgi:hypothetical protein